MQTIAFCFVQSVNETTRTIKDKYYNEFECPHILIGAIVPVAASPPGVGSEFIMVVVPA